MKKKIIYAVCLIIIILAAPSCEKSCQSCKWVITDSSNGEVTEDPGETEYCGATLALIKTKSTTIGTRTTTYKCR